MRSFSSRAVGVIGGSLLLGIGLVVAARSCGTADASLAGVWHGYGAMPPGGGEDPRLARNIAGVTLTLTADGRFQLVDGGLPLAGQWRRKDDAILFDVETLMNRPIGTQPGQARTAIGALSGKVTPGALIYHSLAGEGVRLTRQP